MVARIRLLGLLLALLLGTSALLAAPPPQPPNCVPGQGICKICGCGSRCPVCPICCSID